jgi:DNA repair protein RecO (recombination protein O)
MAVKRISDEPAYVLHRYDWSESSLTLEVLTRHLGRIALVAKGAKRPTSSFRPVLLPLQPLRLAFGGEAEVKTLKAAEWQGGHVMPTGEALMAGYYVNELLLKLLAREDPHPRLFDAYAQVVAILASEHGEALEAALRAFELLLLREIGLLPLLHTQTTSWQALQPQEAYCLVAEGGLRPATPADRASLCGAQWAQLQDALHEQASLSDLLHACAGAGASLKPQLRQLLHYHCGVPVLRTRQVWQELQQL